LLGLPESARRATEVGAVEMRGERHNFGLATRLEADSVGPPGQRRFRLLALSPQGSAWLWLEKEQLQALGMAIDQLLGELPALWSLSRASAQRPPKAVAPPSQPTLEIQVGQLGLGYDEDRRQFVLQAHDSETDAEEPPTFACWATRPQLQLLTRQITDIVNAGRPRCPLCHAPLTEGPHSCPGHNGHQ